MGGFINRHVEFSVMTHHEFRKTRDIFITKDVFSENYSPEVPIERDDEIDEYMTALEDSLFGDQPSNILTYGKTGVGKTVVTKYVLNLLVETATERDVDIEYFEVNCGSNQTSYQVALSLLNKIRAQTGQSPLNRGYGFSEVMSRLYEQIESLDATVYVMIDEIDYLGGDDRILYELPRAYKNGYLDTSFVGVIGISNDYSYRQNLSSKVKDTLQEREIRFPPYNASELQSILRERASEGMKSGVVGNGVIEQCAALGARDTGSARQAIDLLREAGNVAEEASADEVEVSHVEHAKERVKRGRIRDGVTDLTDSGLMVLHAVASLARSGETPTRLKSIVSVYEEIATHYGRRPLGESRIRDHVGDLTMLGFVTEERKNLGRAGGQFYQYSLAVDSDLVYDVVSERLS
ncbi:cell division control protein Cdc6 [Haloferax sp. Atlit-6N]|nr:cell division control protein Cdc6 [Haloferax sp. Atlit-6N]